MHIFENVLLFSDQFSGFLPIEGVKNNFFGMIKKRSRGIIYMHNISNDGQNRSTNTGDIAADMFIREHF